MKSNALFGGNSKFAQAHSHGNSTGDGYGTDDVLQEVYHHEIGYSRNRANSRIGEKSFEAGSG